jgi:hypothetical protein
MGNWERGEKGDGKGRGIWYTMRYVYKLVLRSGSYELSIVANTYCPCHIGQISKCPETDIFGSVP